MTERNSGIYVKKCMFNSKVSYGDTPQKKTAGALFTFQLVKPLLIELFPYHQVGGFPIVTCLTVL